MALDSGEGGIDVRGRPSVLYRNRAGAGFVDVSRSAHVAGEDLYTHGVTVCDYDADGFDDLVVAGYGGVQVWRNQGDGTAAEVSQGLGIVSEKWNVTAAAADYDNDGLIDLYLLTYADWRPDPGEACLNDQGLRDICGPTLYPGERDVLFRNSGHAFEDVTDEVGLVPANRGLGVVAADFNADGAIDFAVVNDVEENQLYLNGPAGVFRDEALLWGAAYSATGEREGSMGVEAGDYDGDAQLDLWYTNYAQQDNSLLRNVAHNGFVQASGASGLTGVSRQWVGFGTILADFNGDGWDDIFIANGHVAYERRDSPYFQPPQLFRSEAGRRFVDVSGEGGPYFDLAWSGRGAFRTDWDEDGAWDIAVSHQNDPVALLHNRRPPKAWIKLDLIGTATNRDAVGASATVHTAKRSITRWRIGGGSYLSHSDSRLLFALDDPASPIEATIRWPAGAVEIFGPLVPARTHSLVEGRGRHADP